MIDQNVSSETVELVKALEKVLLVATDLRLLKKCQLKAVVDMLVSNMHSEQLSAVINKNWVQE